MTASRTDRLAALLAEPELDALLVSDPAGVRYLTGFTGTSGLALVGVDRRALLTDFRYVEQAGAQVDGFDVVDAGPDLLARLGDVLGDGARRLGFDDASLTVAQHVKLGEALDGGVALVAAGGLVERLRAVKDADELGRIRAAAELADEAFAEAVAGGLSGRSERAVALALEDAIRRRGAPGPSFASIVAAGAHGALPHAEPRDVEIPAGTLVIVDWGARLEGYCSDCTRTLATGPLDGEATEAYELVRRAQLAGLDAVRAGPTGRELDAAARAVIEAGGHGERFGHGLGHGVGLEVHEGPRLSRQSDAELAAGMVVTVEPGVYLPGRFGVRIEDLVAVTDDGCEVLSSTAKELAVVG